MRGTRLAGAMAAMLLALGAGIAGAAERDLGPHFGSAPEVERSELLDASGANRTFRLSDGRRETRLYGTPAGAGGPASHWESIGDSEGATLADGAGPVGVRLPEQIDAGAARVSAGGEWVASKLLGPSTGPIDLNGAAARYATPDAKLSLHYTPLPGGLKEDIEIANASQPNAYSFELSASAGLTPSLEAGGAIAFRDAKGEFAFILPPPKMADGATHPAVSRAVHYELGPEEEGRWRLTVSADRTWLADPDRAWPVRIDPTIVTDPPFGCVIGGHKGQTGWIDCSSWGRKTFLAGYAPDPETEEEDNWWRTLMNFETEAIPPTAEVESATFHIRSTEAAQNTEGVELRKVTKPWTWQASWSRYDGPENLWDQEGGDYSTQLGEILTAQRGSQAGWWDFALPPEAIAEALAEEEDLPVILKLLDDKVRECGEESCIDRQVTFDSSATEDEEDRPYLSVLYSVDEGPVAAYSFDEGSGETAHDDSANGHHGTLEGPEWSEGKYGSALDFEAAEADCVSVPDSPQLQLTGNFTLEAWIRPEAKTEDDPVIFKETDGFLSYGLFLTKGGYPEAVIAPNEEEELVIAKGAEQLAQNAWHSLGATYDGEGLRLYVDGELAASEETEGPIASEKPLRLGCSRTWEEGFTGKIDNIRLYDRALSLEELEEDEEAPLSAPAPAVTSEAASDVGLEAARLNATVNPNGLETAYRFEYGTSAEYGQLAPAEPKGIGSGTEAKAVSEAIEGLEAGTTYHFRISATSEAGTSYGEDGTFTTISPDPIASYSFDEGTGETAYDDSGNGHDGTVHGAEWSEAGKYGGALDFEAGGDRVTIPDAADLDFTGAFTLEAWVRPEKYREWAHVISKGEPGEEPEYAYLLYASSDEDLPVASLSDAEGAEYPVAGSEALPTSAWSHLAVTADGSYERLYVDGELLASASAATAGTNDASLRIGGNWDWGDYFDGKIDNVRVYDRALSAEEIEADGEAPVAAPAPEATTEEATGVETTEATLHGRVNPNGRPTTYQFEYGTTTEYGSSIPASPKTAGSGESPVAVSETVEGLEEETEYHYRVRVDSDGGTVYGKDMTLVTFEPPETTIIGGAYSTTARTAASFQLTSEFGATFECRLDAGSWQSCSPHPGYTSLGAGSHTFEARAVDEEGALDPTPAQRGWVVDPLGPVARPEVEGTPRIGRTLSVSNGSWGGAAPTSYSYQWYRCQSSDPSQFSSCLAIEGATSSQYGLNEADKGQNLVAQVTANRSETQSITLSRFSLPALDEVVRSTLSERLVFTGCKGDNWMEGESPPSLTCGLWMTTAAGSDPILVWENEEIEGVGVAEPIRPTLSTDGALIAYMNNVTNCLMVIPAQANGSPQEVDCAEPEEVMPYHQPAFTPDGKIVYADWKASQIWKIDIDGTGKEAVITWPNAPKFTDPSVSPDGSYLAFSSTGGPSGEAKEGVWVTTTAGTEPRFIQSQRSALDWSPDGGRLVLLFDDQPGTAGNFVGIYDLASSTRTKFGPTLVGNAGPTWSADGELVAVTRVLANGDQQLVLIDPATGFEQEILSDFLSNLGPLHLSFRLAADSKAITPNDLLERYKPVVYYHPEENYFSDTVEGAVEWHENVVYEASPGLTVADNKEGGPYEEARC